MKNTANLSDLLYKSSVSKLGSDEHLQIAGMISSAKKFVIQKDSARNLREVLDADPIQFERNLDLVERPDSEIWYEWPIRTRTGHGGGDDARTGCLVAPHPADDRLSVVVTGWSDGKSARHAYAIGLFNTEILKNAAEFARKTRRQDRESSYTRILQTIGGTISPGFRDEIAILSEGSKKAIPAALRDGTAEVPFLLAILIASKCADGLQHRHGTKGALSLPKTKVRKDRRLMDALLRREREADIVDRLSAEPKWIP